MVMWYMKTNKYLLCTKNDKQTFELGVQLAKLKIKSICLVGDLGSGKTILAKGYAKGLGIKGHITSPTFNIINRYEENDIIFNHMDAYRITDEEMLYDIGFEELFDKDSYVIIEWANNIENAIPKDTLWIYIKRDTSNINTRYITINCNKEQLLEIGLKRIC